MVAPPASSKKLARVEFHPVRAGPICARFGEKMLLNYIELTLQTMLLGCEAQSVIGLRMRKLAQGGPAALTETHRMLSEKIAALAESIVILGAGGTAFGVVRGLRVHVQANEARLLG